ncbi:MAG TPA: hypothetical protein VFW42_06400 [Fluviicoccus sp.]|nr:hypothetical protein [Fluviicoccus sp.]
MNLKKILALYITTALVLQAHAEDSDVAKNSLSIGYGAWSRTWLNDRISDEIGDFILGGNNFGANSRLHSSGIFQANYSWRLNERWSGTATYTKENFRNMGAKKSWLLGVRNDHQVSEVKTIYWGIALGRSTLTDDVNNHETEGYAWQLNIGRRWQREAWFVFTEFGLGDVGLVSAGVGREF